jgi:putative DNA primase/helicase
MNGPHVEQFRDAIQRAGINPPPTIIADGKLHRFPTNGKRDDDSGWYVLHDDGVPAGAYGDWRTGIEQKWRADIGRKLTFTEAEELKRKADAAHRGREAEEAQQLARIAAEAQAIWNAAGPAPEDHPYLVAKGIKPHGARLYVGNLVLAGVPCYGALVLQMRDISGNVQGIEFITPDGTKRFLGSWRGAFFAIPSAKKRDLTSVIVVEGFATGASVAEATGETVLAAFCADNLRNVALAVQSKRAAVPITIGADDDYHTAGNPGATQAIRAARAVGGVLAIPDFGADRPDGATDFNDLARRCGAGAVERAIANARAPDEESPQPDALNATASDSGVRVLTLAEIVSYEFPEREAILKPWLLTQSLSMIHAWRGIGKTHIALGIAYAVATGGKFLTWEAEQPWRVLYVDGEMPGAALKARLVALIDTDERDFDPSYLRIITPDAQGDAPMPDLATAEGQAAVEAAAADADLVILDNISTLYRDAGPENDAESWRVAQGWALRMRRAGKAVLFIHHSGKGGAQRGSSKREDTLDVVINLKRPSDYSPEQGARFELYFEKYRNSSGKDDAKAIEAALTTDANGYMSWTWRSVEDSTFERVVSLTNDGLKPGEIAHELGIHKSRVSHHLKRARSEGKVRASKGPSHAE